MNYIIAVGWGILGWMTRVAWTYWKHSKEVESKPRGKFKWHSFRKKYDQDWVFGFISMVFLSVVSDVIWSGGLDSLVLEDGAPYDARVNMLIGYMSIYVIEKLSRK